MIKFKIKHSTLPMTNYIESFKLKLRFTKQRARLNQLFTRALLGEISEKHQSYRKHISPIWAAQETYRPEIKRQSNVQLNVILSEDNLQTYPSLQRTQNFFNFRL